MNTNPEITGTTKLCGVMGDPVEHSVSPAMHNAAFRALGLDYAYLPFRVRREDLPAALQGMRALNIRGLNVTIPHKVAILPLLDEIDPLARQIGAVNVLLNDHGRLSGYNTDAQGFLRMLTGNGIDPQGKNIAVMGAGGAARAISFALASRGAALTILNRTAAPAQACAADISKTFGLSIKVLDLNRENLAHALQQASLLVNATSVGMSPQADATPVDRELLGPHITVVDIVYNPCKSKLLKEAEQAGARTINGLEMLVWQGALAFEIWTGGQPPLNVMRQAATAAVKSYEKPPKNVIARSPQVTKQSQGITH
jgi:shikimate dehydrogenase